MPLDPQVSPGPTTSPRTGSPIYDQTDLGGFYVAIGTSGNQFKNAPVVGQIMATLPQWETGVNHDSTPVVWTAPYTGLQINLGHYSRLRVANADSSFSTTG